MKRAHVIWFVNLLLLTMFLTSLATGVSGYRREPNGVTISQEEETTVAPEVRSISMALSVSVASAAAAYAVTETGKAAIGSITEKPELFGRTIIYVGLAEGIAIYGLLVSFLLWIGFA